MMRAQIQAESLKNFEKARSLLLASRKRPRTRPPWFNWPGSSWSGISWTPPKT